MKDIFKSHKELSEEDYQALWANATFIFDTNTLLDLYRLPDTARKDFLNILSDKKLKHRLWLPFQVALEFTHNRLDAISDQKNKFNNVRSIVSEGIEEINTVYSRLSEKLTKLQLKKRHSVINPDSYINENLFKESTSILNKFLADLASLDRKQPDVNDKDAIRDVVESLFKDKTGTGLSKEKLEELFKDGELRYKDNIPPGYKDRDKDGFYLYNDRKHLRKFGDLILWKEIIEKSQVDKLEYVILVTGDSKEDWWQEKRGKKLGPRYELLNEIYYSVPSLKVFYMYDASGFMQYAKQQLKINIKEQSIKETKDLLEFQNSSEQITTTDNNIISIKEYIRQVGKQIPIKIRFSGGFENAPFVHVPIEVFSFILMEILSNVYNHSLDKTVTVRIKEEENYLVLRFRNLTGRQDISSELRGKGIEYIRSVFEGRFGRVETALRGNIFQIKLSIDKKFTSTPKITKLF